MKIYTRSGDDGSTGLFGGGRVPKDDPRVRAYGAVDEANASLGLARALLADDPDLSARLARLQGALLDLGADLATPLTAKARAKVPAVQDDAVARLEGEIDELETELSPLTSFVLPGGTPAAAALHGARTVLRRAEREAVASHREVGLNEAALRYLNRASDLLFVLARVANHRAGIQEPLWEPGAGTASPPES